MSIADKIKGGAKELGGKIKEGMGHATDDAEAVKEGREDQFEGEAQQTAADVDSKVQGTLDQVKGRVKSTVGAATGDESMEAGGKLDELKGKVQKKISDL